VSMNLYIGLCSAYPKHNMSTDEDKDSPQGASQQDNANQDLMEIGQVFHEHSTNLLTIRQVITRAAETLGPSPFDDEGEPNVDKINTALINPINSLSAAVKRFIEAVEGNLDQRGISQGTLDRFAKINEKLSEYQGIDEAGFRPPFFYGISKNLLDLIERLDQTALPKEKVRNIKQYAKEIQRLICLYDLAECKSRIIAMDNQTQSLLSHLTQALRPKGLRKVVQVQDLLKSIVTGMEEYARDRRIELRLDLEACKARVEVEENDVRRALRNILQNAIKYSDQLPEPQRAWVHIRCFGEEKYTCIRFENWGVPITKDEIEKGLIFRSGYRGAFSGAEGRGGSGLGLNESMRVALEHSGEITVESYAAREPASYKQPFITVFVFKLPRY
jgi:signal transduction histidine kinase